METQHHAEPVRPSPFAFLPAPAADAAAVAQERLPFTVKVVHSEQQLRKAVYMRHAAYARHVPALAEVLAVPEPYDHDEGSVVLLAESKLDGTPIGTMRIQTNRFQRLALEQSVELPAWLRGPCLAEATRLGVSGGQIGRLVKTALFKAYYLYCVATGIDWMVIGARAPLDRQYAALLFRDVLADGQFVPLRHAGNIPHRVLAFEVASAQARWRQSSHPLYGFMVLTRHPDIEIGQAAPARETPARVQDAFDTMLATA